MGFTAKGDGVRLYLIVVKMDESPKLIEVFTSVENGQTTGGNASSLPNRETLVRSNKQDIIDFITTGAAAGAVYDTGVTEPE